MTRTMMIAAVALAAYALINVVVSLFVALLWRTRAVAPTTLPPAVRARRLWLLRIAPTVVGLSLTAILVMPAFINYEPVHDGEASGPVLLILGGLTLLQFVVAGYVAARSWWSTRQLQRNYETGARHAPMVALVGIFDPVLVVSHEVTAACDSDEIARIVAHERGHLQSHDNIKRWVMHFLTGVLRPTAIHAEIVTEWHHASEDAADDAATGDDVVARADLAALLLKVVRLTPRREWSDAIVSPFVERDHGLERRVRRLLRNELEKPAPFAIVPTLSLVLLTGVTLATINSPRALEVIFDLFEALVAFGR